jgi:hypothetical protein
MIQDEVVRARAAQTVIARRERRDIQEVTSLAQRFGNAFARERIFVDYRDRDLRISFGNLTCGRL